MRTIIKQKLKKTNNNRLFVALCFIAFSILFNAITLSSKVNAEAVQSTLTLTLDSLIMSVEVSPSANGVFAKSEDYGISVSTNNFTGYTLSIKAENSTDLVGVSNPNNTLPSISTAISEATYSSNSAYNNTWGYRPSQYVTTSGGINTTIENTNFLPSPTTSGTLIAVTESANNNADNYSIAIGARANYAQASDSYSNSFIITAIGNPVAYSIYYNANTTDAVNNMPTSPQGASVPGGTATIDSKATLSDKTPTRTGYNFVGWCDVATTDDANTGSQTCPGNTYQASAYYGIDQTTDPTNINLYAIWQSKTYTITLNKNGGTGGSNTATATYKATTLSSITKPSRSYTISGFTTPSGNNADGATVSSSSSLTSTYTFNGWYQEAAATHLIASNATTPVLQANTAYTDANGKWTSTSTQTLYAGWTGQAKTLPTITKTGYTCGWTTTSTGATSIQYASGASFAPTANTTLYGVCVAKSYTITLNANGGTDGSSSTTATYGANTLATITNPTRANSTYSVSGFTLTPSGANATVSSTSSKTSTQTYTFNGWYKESSTTNKIASNATTPALQANTTYTNNSSQWTYDGTTILYAGWTANGYSAVTLPTITRTGSTCGWSTSSTATTITYASGASITPTNNTTLYGVCITNVTFNGNGATTQGTTSVNLNYGAQALGSITTPQRSYNVSGYIFKSSFFAICKIRNLR